MDYNPDLPPEKKLDIVLQKVVNLPATDNLYYSSIVTHINAIGYEKEVFEILLLKLRKDGYIASDTESGQGVYASNFDGRLFIDNGGYSKKKELDADAIKFSSRILTRDRIYRKRLLWATWSAGIAALLLLLWQIFVWLHPIYANYPYILFGVKP